jgi:hypothetical protein
MGGFFVWSPWMFQHVIVFHISIVMCCLGWIPFDRLGGLPIAALRCYYFVSSSLGLGRRFINGALERFVVDE